MGTRVPAAERDKVYEAAKVLRDSWRNYEHYTVWGAALERVCKAVDAAEGKRPEREETE